MTEKYKKKLIEVAIPLEAINAASAREKSIRHGHPSTLHLWWARRPLAACRAILFAQLVDDPSEYVDTLLADSDFRKKAEAELAERTAAWEKRIAENEGGAAEIPKPALDDCAADIERQRLFVIIEDLVKWENSTNEEVLSRARAEIARCCCGELPPVYDPFSGGGSIPLEAQRLGLPAHGSDLNPVAVMIGKAMLEIPLKFSGQDPVHPGEKKRLQYRRAEGLAEDILWYADKLREKARGKIGHLYPKVNLSKKDGGGEETVLGWLWARTVASPNPAMAGVHIPLVSTFWLCRKPKKKIWIEPVVQGQQISFEVRYDAPDDEEAVAAGTKMGRGANFKCLLTGDAVTADYVKAEGMAGRMGWKLLVIVAEGKKGRRYAPPAPEHEAVAFSEKPEWRPELLLSQHPQYMSVTNYGPKNISDLFMDRQTIALETFIKLIPDVVKELNASQEYKDAIATYLSLGVSRLANRQSTSTFWDNGAENIQQVFAMQALPMRWDTAEGNPFSSSSGNFIGQIEYLAKNIARLPASEAPGHITQKSAQSVDFSGFVISCDPPYYDNVPYADLSDFFYVWLNRALKKIYPDLFATMLVPKADELVADHQRHGGKDNADLFFLQGMTKVMRNMAEQGRTDFPAAIYYAFRQGEVGEGGTASKGWATFLQAVMDAGYQIGATWPVRTELVGNLKKKKNVLATSVVLSCRPRTNEAAVISQSEFSRLLKRELPDALREMQKANIAPVDMPQASIGPGIDIFSRHAAVLESDDSHMTARRALQIINHALDEFLAEQEGEFDADTRFALTWYVQHGYGEGLFGDADGLARARGISVDSVKDAGVVESSAGKVRILRRDELLDDWDPAADKHLTIWECLQYLIRALENEGEEAAALLIKKFGSDKTEAVKELAYVLHKAASEKLKDAKEATSYNALIAVWTELTRMAPNVPDVQPDGQIQIEI